MLRIFILVTTLFVPSSLSGEPQAPLKLMFSNVEQRYSLPSGILSALSYVESKHRASAFVRHDGKSHKASHGLVQIQMAAARQMGFKGTAKELMVPSVNIEYGAAYLNWLLMKKNKDVARALVCYNSGLHSSLCKSGLYTNYVGLVLNALVAGK